jgi:plasmid stabilization system protein ParE
MKRAYRITRSAKRNLQEISDYWVECAGPDVALTVVTSITETITTLADQPKAGIAAGQFGEGVRKFPTGSYIIYYRAYRSRGIEILHVFHGARNQKRAWEGKR